MYDSQPGNLPPCELSSHCSRLLDELVGDSQDGESGLAFAARDRHDQRLIIQLRAHLPHCPTCTAALRQAQALRSGQRALLRDYLNDSEAAVPPTTAHILQILREQEQSPDSSTSKRANYRLPGLPNLPATDAFDSFNTGETPSTRTTEPLLLVLSPARRWLRNSLTFATIAALIFTAVGVFSHYVARSVNTMSGLQTQVAKVKPGALTQTLASPVTSVVPASSTVSPSPTAPASANQGWDGLVLITTVAMSSVIATYNYQNGDHRDLARVDAPLQFDGVGSYGQNMLYQVIQNGQTLFYTLNQLPTTGYFYELDTDDVLNAIWMPDNLHVLIATLDSGVIMVNSQTGQAQPFLPDLQTGGLKFYRGDYLYFLGGADRLADTLYRVNMNSGVVQQVTGRSIDGGFWLSPDGQTVYYKSASPGFLSTSGVYAVSSDGLSSQVMRLAGLPIGYAPDNSLIVIRQVGHAFEVIQVGATPAHDRVLLPDAAPGAVSLCSPSITIAIICNATTITLAPLSHALVVVASYPNGNRKVWSDDLVTGQQFVIMQPDANTSVSVPGWDRIAVA